MIQKAYKFRIYPTEEQIIFFDESVRTSNFIYNSGLRKQKDILDELDNLGITDKEKRKQYMKDNNLYFNRYELSKEITQLSKTEKYSFLSIPDTTSRTYALKALESAFKKMKDGSGYPKFKNRASRYSFTGQIQYKTEKNFNMKLCFIKNKYGLLSINKVKDIKILCHIPFFIDNWNNKNIIKFNSYTISKNNERYFISFQCEVNDPKFVQVKENKQINEETSIGIDLGVSRPITTSDPLLFDEKLFKESISLLKEYKEELKRLSIILNRKRDYHKKNVTDVKFYDTESYKRVKKKLNKTHFKISEKRNYIQHMITNRLINLENIDTYILEELNVKGMMKKSGKNKSNNKKGLNRVLSDVGLGSIRTKLEYKANRIGKNVLTVDPKCTSQKCSECGYINKLNRTSQAKFECKKCGFTLNADLNAAINIKNKFFNKKVL